MKRKKKNVLAWHFLPGDMRLGYHDRREVRDGGTLRYTGSLPVLLCFRGLHASLKILDALPFAEERPVLCRVRVGGTRVHQTNKLAGSARTCLWHVDARRAMRLLAFRLALESIVHSTDRALLRHNAARDLLVAMHYAFHRGNFSDPERSGVYLILPHCYYNSVCSAAMSYNHGFAATNTVAKFRSEHGAWHTSKVDPSRVFRRFIGMERRGELGKEITRVKRQLRELAGR